jgi:hypothetical protein
LTIFQSGREKLAQAIAVHTEVSFVPLYKGQPTYGAIDAELRSLGFIPHAFAAINKRMIGPLIGDTPYEAMNQLLEADAVYVRDFRRPMEPEQLKHLALVAHHCYRSYDLAVNCAHRLMRQGVLSDRATEEYIATLPLNQ